MANTEHTAEEDRLGDERALLLTVEAAAQRLSISRVRVYDMIRTGQIRSVKLGRSRRIPVAALEELVRSAMFDPSNNGPTAA